MSKLIKEALNTFEKMTHYYSGLATKFPYITLTENLLSYAINREPATIRVVIFWTLRVTAFFLVVMSIFRIVPII